MPKALETVLEIDLNKLKHNYTFLKGLLKPETKFLAVVKAYAYGNQPETLALYLEQLGVDYFAVAYTYEGVALRNAGVKAPILVLHPMPVNFKELIAHCLEPNLYNQRVFNEFVKVASDEGQTNYPVHIKFNTGLNRLGFGADEVGFISEGLKNSPQVKVKSLFSHLIASEDHSLRELTLKQISSFKNIAASFEEKNGYKPMLHMLNTSGILNYAEEAQFNMVRSGIGLYGFGNAPTFDKNLKPIATLKSVISQINHLTTGESVGYNCGYIAPQPIITATIPLGHADGIGRQYGKGKGFVTINGKKAPIVGNVCMDMLMVNITGIDCNEGDEVIIFGQNPTADVLAATAGTISYELITGISQRVKRVFLK